MTATWNTPPALHRPGGLTLVPWMHAGCLLCQAASWDGGFKGDPASDSTYLAHSLRRNTGKTKLLRDLGVHQPALQILVTEAQARGPRLV